MKAIRHFIPWFLVAACLPVSAQRGLKEIPPPDPELEKASFKVAEGFEVNLWACLLYTSPSPRDRQKSRMPSSA